MLAVTPREDDPTAEFAEAAGIPVLRQGIAKGLTDLWNQVRTECYREKSPSVFECVIAIFRCESLARRKKGVVVHSSY